MGAASEAVEEAGVEVVASGPEDGGREGDSDYNFLANYATFVDVFLQQLFLSIFFSRYTDVTRLKHNAA
jgi:hypothetical protein